MKKQKKWYYKYWGILVFGIFALIIIGASTLASKVISDIQLDAQIQEYRDKFLITADDPFAGSPEAKVHIIEFSDFQCPFCKKSYPIIKDLIETYGDQIHFIYRDFPVKNHGYAKKAAEAGECAQDQGKFWELHDKIFENQKNLALKDLKKYAIEIGVPDMIKFNECLDSGKYEQEVQDDYQAGEKAGVRGTPTFFINGEVIHGAVPKEEMVKVIEKYL